MPEIAEFKHWLANASTDEAIVETIEARHPELPTLRLARWHEDFAAPDETGTSQTFMAGDFVFAPPEVANTTAQSAVLTISALDGLIYDRVRQITPAGRLTAIEIVHRLYFADRRDRGPLLTPPPVWFIEGLQVTTETVTADLIAVHLRERIIGRYYTFREFAILRYV